MRQIMSWTENTYANFAASWRQASSKKKALMYVAVYTIVFLTAFLIAYSPFLLSGKTFIWQFDGRTQHFPYMVYIGKTLRRIVLNLMNGQFVIPQFDLNIGPGDDVIGFLSSQGQTDPLLLLSAFVPVRYSEYLYDFLVFFRVYLAGLTFSFLCFYFGKRAMHTLIGSVVYCFSGYAIYCSVRHPHFINPMISLPLLIVGTDKILKKEKPYLFILAMCYAALCGFYHLYMMTIILAVYALVRFFDLHKENRPKEFLTISGGGMSAYLLGIGLAAVIFLPAVAEFLNAGRAGFSNYNGAYSLQYYGGRVRGLFSPPGTWDTPALAVIVLFAFCVLAFSKGRRTLKILIVTALAVLLTSLGGLVMGGFQYSSNRWTFGLALVAAYAVANTLPDMLNLSRKQQKMFLAVFVAYALMCAVLELMKAKLLGKVIVYAPFLAVFLISTLLVFTKCGTMSRGIRECMCLMLVIVNVGVNGIYKFAPDQGNYVGEFQKSRYEVKRLESAVERELEPYLSNAPKGRGDGTEFSVNTSMVWQIPGLLSFTSILNRNFIEFLNRLENCGNWMNFYIYSTDQRAAANTLLSVKYQVESEDRAGYVPYGYRQIQKTEKGNLIYENNYALPWGYTYDRAISYDQVDDLNGVMKQEVMLQAIALDEEQAGINLNTLQFDEKRLPYKVICKDCTWKDGKLIVSKANADVMLRFSMPKNVEGYVRLKGFDINDSGISDFYFRVKCEDVVKTASAASHLFTWYYGRENYLFNLGYSERERNSLTITFPVKGTFKLKDIELIALPMDNYPARVEALRAEPLKNIRWGTNTLTGTVDLSKDKILCVSVPYSKGWSATVDGQKADILRGNYMFLALPLKAGHHDIVFSYCTPGLKLGAVISALSAALVAGMFMRDRRRRKAQ